MAGLQSQRVKVSPVSSSIEIAMHYVTGVLVGFHLVM
jgi:hypothetical protein